MVLLIHLYNIIYKCIIYNSSLFKLCLFTVGIQRVGILYVYMGNVKLYVFEYIIMLGIYFNFDSSLHDRSRKYPVE